MRKLHWWDDDDRDVSLAPRHSKALVSNRDKHRVNNLRQMAEEGVSRAKDQFPQEPSKALVYA